MKLRYVELPPARIFNWLDPFNITAKWACKAITGNWWSKENVAIRRFFADAWTEEFNKITGHFTSLEESIKKKGILTPINTESGPPRGTYLKPHHYPPSEQGDLSQAIHTTVFGGSRLTIALKLGLDVIPCIVQDHANIFADAPEVTVRNYRQWFDSEYSFTSGPPHLRCRSMNREVKAAQDKSADVARAKTYAEYKLSGK